jgi:DnaJ-domain-containing protein 1
VQEVLAGEFDEPSFIVKVEVALRQQKFEEANQMVSDVVHKRFRGRVSSKLGELFNRAQQLLKRSKMKDYYKILGVSPDLDEQSLKRVYRKLALQYDALNLPACVEIECKLHMLATVQVSS